MPKLGNFAPRTSYPSRRNAILRVAAPIEIIVDGIAGFFDELIVARSLFGPMTHSLFQVRSSTGRHASL
jgi:hypothetical protein